MHGTFIKPCCAELHFAVSASCACPAPLSSALRIALCSCLCAFTHCRSFYCTYTLSYLQLAPESRQILALTLIIPLAEISSVFPFAFVYKGQILRVSVVTEYFQVIVKDCIQATSVRVLWPHAKVRTLPLPSVLSFPDNCHTCHPGFKHKYMAMRVWEHHSVRGMYVNILVYPLTCKNHLAPEEWNTQPFD